MLSCVQLCDPMDCSLPGSSVHGSKNTGVISLGVFPIQGSNLPLLRLLHLPLSHQESPINTQCYQVQPFGSHYWKVDWLLVMSLKSEDGLCYDQSISPGINLTEKRDLSYYERKTHAKTPSSNCLDSWPSMGTCQTCGNINPTKIYCLVTPRCLPHSSSIRQICFLPPVCLMTREKGRRSKKIIKSSRQVFNQREIAIPRWIQI